MPKDWPKRSRSARSSFVAAKGWLYDGTRAAKLLASVERMDGHLFVEADGLGVEHIDPRGLVHIERRGAEHVYGRRTVDGWRVGIVPSDDPAVAELLPSAAHYGAWIDRVGLWKGACALALASALVVVGGYTAPTWLAPLVPFRWERALGDALVGEVAGGRFCQGEEGLAALARLAARLNNDVAVDVRVADIGVPNAVALPGGHIVFFDPILRHAASPDEIAGILAHEIAHVAHRDSMEALLREVGIGMMLAAFGGSAGGSAADLVSLSYSRDAEAAADSAAVKALIAANISPAPTAAFFRRLGGGSRRSSGAVSRASRYLASHPHSGERADAFREAADEDADYDVAMTDAEWQAVRGICRDGEEEDAA